jgi:hypothetical protein
MPPRVVRSIGLLPEIDETLRGINASSYIQRLLEHFPPPPIATLDELAELVRAGHPWACLPGTTVAREGMPTFGGEPPASDPEAASWDEHRVMNRRGAITQRSDGEPVRHRKSGRRDA